MELCYDKLVFFFKYNKNPIIFFLKLLKNLTFHSRLMGKSPYMLQEVFDISQEVSNIS